MAKPDVWKIGINVVLMGRKVFAVPFFVMALIRTPILGYLLGLLHALEYVYS